MAIPDSVLPSSVAWTIKQGATFVKEFTWTEDDEVTPIGDFTGGNWSAEMQLRDPTDLSVAPALIVKTTPGAGEGKIEIIDDATFRITIAEPQTKALAKKTYIFDLELTNSTPTPDVVLTPIEGNITVKQNYTQAVGAEVILT
jgi:hypothetical protein